MHGDETEGVRFLWDFAKEYPSTISPYKDIAIYLLPVLNPDGVISRKRQNARGVDLNRNLPTKDWRKEYTEEKYYPGEKPLSEKENQVLVELIKRYKPQYILTLHSYSKKALINPNGKNAIYFAKPISQRLSYPIEEDMGYPTPGSLGTYAGEERGIPTITFEFLRGEPHKGLYQRFKDALLSSLEGFYKSS